MKQLRRHTYYLLLVGCLLTSLVVGCKKEPTTATGGSLQYDGQNYPIKSVRQRCYIDTLSGQQRIEVAFCSPKMSFADGKMVGTGALVVLTMACDSDHLVVGQYDILPDSYAIIIADDKSDTICHTIDGGSLEVSSTENGRQYAFAAGSITGSYTGTCTYNYDIDGAPCGQITINDSIVPLQEGDLLLWGPIFDDNLHYYEFYFYSCNLRHTDAGAIKQGIAFVVGLHSANTDAPANGTYPIGSANLDQTAMYGHRSGNNSWGTYWTNYLTASTQTKANVLTGNIAITSENGKYTFTFDCADQLGNKITGTHSGTFRTCDVR